MATTHDYAGCQVAVCQQCDSYADGYTAGKAKAFSEIRAVPSSDHRQDCGCRPCGSVREAIRAMVGLDHRGLTPKYARMFADSQRQQRPATPQDTEEAESI